MKKIILLWSMLFYCLQFCVAQSGELDLSFGNKGIVLSDAGKSTKNETNARKVLLQPDGSMVEIFDFQGFAFITKRHSDGTADTTYGHNGFTAGIDLNATDAALQSDGKVVIVGTSVARYNADGTVDSSFGENGKLKRQGARSVAIQADAKIVISGYYYISRYNTNGGPDSTFSADGSLTTGFYNGAAAIQDDGKIVTAGYTFDGEFVSMALARYNANGDSDSSFAVNGKFTNTENPTSDEATSVAVGRDGKIVVAGGTTKRSDSYYLYDMKIWRFNANGTADSSFSDDGRQTTNFNYGYSNFASVALQSDEKIVCVSATTLARFNTHGSLDKSFSNDGKQYSNLITRSVAIQHNGNIVFDGRTTEIDVTFNIVRLHSNGTADKTFGKNGVVEDQLQKGDTEFKSIAVQKDGKSVAVGRTWNGQNYDFVIARYNLNGSLDENFSGDGFQTTGFGASSDYANAVVIQNDGKIVVAGYSDDTYQKNFAVARYNSDGSPDNTFSSDGKQIIDFGSDDIAASAAIQYDGKIVVAGSTGPREHHDLALIRFNTDGSLDHTFAGDGMKTSDYRLRDDKAMAVVIQNDNKIVVAGYSGYGIKTDFAVFRYNSDGSLDHTFSDDGVQTTSFGSVINSIALQSDGKIVAAGNTTESLYYTPAFGIVRFNVNGTLDSSFSEDGKQIVQFSYQDYPASVKIQNDGKIIVGGNFGDNNTFEGFALARFNTDGSPDSSFSKDGKQTIISTVYGDSRYNALSDIAISNNKLYAAGTDVGFNHQGLVMRFLLDNDSIATPPTVSITTPADNATYPAPAAHIKLSAAATDKDGTITKVEFYNGTAWLHTETVIPYGYVWRNVPSGNYTITAKAYDNNGNIATSAPVHISVVPNKSPVVSIIQPINNQSFTAPANIHFEAAASDTDGRITRVEFYKASTLLRTEYQYPYTYNWLNVPAGTYTVTAKATDNYGVQTISSPVTVTVTSDTSIVSSRLYSKTGKTAPKDALRLKFSPNPASNIVNIYTNGLQQSKPATLSIISLSGIVLKTMQISNAITHLDVSSLASGMYLIEVISRGKVMYKQFVKL